MGRQLQIKVSDIPQKKDVQKGCPIDNLCDFDRKIEKILYVTTKEKLNGNLLFVTKNGLCKIVLMEEFNINVYKSKATKLKDGDELIAIKK